MKKLKLLVPFMVLAVSIILPQGVNAASYGTCLSGVEYQKDTNTGRVNKGEWGNQSVKINNAFTSMTNPCPNCEFRVKPHNVSTGTLGGTVAKMGGTYSFVNHDGASAPGTYYLKVARFDYTLLKSTVDLTWYY